MSLLDKASLIVTPNSYKESKLYSVVPNTTLGDMDVVRATTATRVNSAGLIEVVPRNLLSYSQDFTNGWTGAGITGTANYGVAPDGTNTSTRLVFSGANQIWSKSISNLIGNNGVFSLYIKGVVGQTILITYAGTTDKTITLLNGWNRYNVNGLGVSNNIFINTFSGATARNIEVWGGQVEQGSTATEYFPTTTRLNIPRIDYTNGSCPSLLVEPQRTNVLTYSEQFNDVSWTKINSLVTANTTISPNGIADADSLINNFGNNQFSRVRKIPGATIGTTYVYSCFFKKGDTNYANITLYDNADFYAFFNLNNGTTENISAGITANIQSYGNGWYRCSVIRTSVTTGIQFSISLSNNSSQYFSNLNNFIYIWGAQLEAGSYATSYVPTVASAITRNADVISKTGISSLIGQTEGTLFIEANNKILGQTNRTLCFVNDTAGNNFILLNYSSAQANTIRFFIVANGINTALAFKVVTTQIAKCAVSYKAGVYKLFINGSLQHTQSGSVFTSNLLNVYLGNNSGVAETLGEGINSFQLYKTQLTDTECIALTTL